MPGMRMGPGGPRGPRPGPSRGPAPRGPAPRGPAPRAPRNPMGPGPMMRPPGPRMRMPMPIMRPRRYYGFGSGGLGSLIILLFLFGIIFLLSNPMIGILLVVGGAIFLAIKLSGNKNESAASKTAENINQQMSQNQSAQSTKTSQSQSVSNPIPATPSASEEKEADNLYTSMIKDQKKRMKTRLNKINKQIESNFANSSITRDKYENALQAAAKTFSANLDYIEEQMDLYKDEGYYPTEILHERFQDNEEILEKLGKLSNELSALEINDEGDALSEDLDDLIEQTKLYKNKNDEL